MAPYMLCDLHLISGYKDIHYLCNNTSCLDSNGNMIKKKKKKKRRVRSFLNKIQFNKSFSFIDICVTFKIQSCLS